MINISIKYSDAKKKINTLLTVDALVSDNR
jgi:hypothetical protein